MSDTDEEQQVIPNLFTDDQEYACLAKLENKSLNLDFYKQLNFKYKYGKKHRFRHLL